MKTCKMIKVEVPSAEVEDLVRNWVLTQSPIKDLDMQWESTNFKWASDGSALVYVILEEREI
jgi:hypothetical protein